MSKRIKPLFERFTRIVQAELKAGTTAQELVGVLEIVKCNVAFAAASVNAAKVKRKKDSNNNH